jgi:hypothetical protein
LEAVDKTLKSQKGKVKNEHLRGWPISFDGYLRTFQAREGMSYSVAIIP